MINHTAAHGRYTAGVLVDQFETAFEKLKPQLSIRLWPNVTGLGKAREQALNDWVDSRRLVTTAPSAALFGFPLLAAASALVTRQSSELGQYRGWGT